MSAPSYADLVAALDAVGAELTEHMECIHQGVFIEWQRRPRPGESFLGLQLADPVRSRVIEYHFVPHDQIPVSDEVMAVTRARALQRAIWDLEDDARCAAQDGTKAAR